MLTFKNYYQPESVEEAYDLLMKKEKSELLGGCIYLRLVSREIEHAIDLFKCNLDYIKENENSIEIGSMETYGDLERSDILKNLFNGVIPKSINHIVGIQLRNIISVGGTIVPSYGFSDLITALLSLDTRLIFHKNGEVKLEDYLNNKKHNKDILEKIIIKKDNSLSYFNNFKKSNNDYSVINIAINKKDNIYKIVVGSRPKVACIANKASEYLNNNLVNITSIKKAATIAQNELDFSSDIRGSGEYRKELCKVLIERTLMEVIK